MGRADIRRDAARGVVAAMAMTGFRRLSVGLGLLEETPPEVMAEQAKVLRPVLERVPERLRGEAVELGHWLYGAAGGAVYGALVRPRLRGRWVGPAYGLAIWAAFETGLVPLLGLEHTEERKIVSRLLVAADHILYGVIVAGESVD
ncbi:MAG: hypothetical protein H0X21_03215 [Actinobacteria bacterium]|nr:hypothetical protein [Actinomycetota bacterium]